MKKVLTVALLATALAACSDPVTPFAPSDRADAKNNNNGRPHFVNVEDFWFTGAESGTWCEAGLGGHECVFAIEGLKRGDTPAITYSATGYFQLYCSYDDGTGTQYHRIDGWVNSQSITVGPAAGPKDRVSGGISTGMPGLDWSAADLGLCPAGSEPEWVEGRGGSGTLTATTRHYTFSVTFDMPFGTDVLAITPALRHQPPRKLGPSRVVATTP